MKLTERQTEVFEEIKKAWNENGRGVILNKKNSLILNNLRRAGLVDIYPAHAPMKGFHQSWEAFPCEGIR